MEANNTRLVPLILLFGWSQNEFRIPVSIMVTAKEFFLSPRSLNIKLKNDKDVRVIIFLMPNHACVSRELSMEEDTKETIPL